MAQRELKIVERGACKEIADKFGCTTATVTNALKARAYSMLTLKIRRYAMQNYTCTYFTGQGTSKRRHEVVRLCQGCRHHIETQEGDWCTIQETYVRAQKMKCKNREELQQTKD